jgi:soluble lytic murein transglycosylase-like protein
MSWSPDRKVERTPWHRWLSVRGGALVAGVLMVATLAGWSGRADAVVENIPPSLSVISTEINGLTRRSESAEAEVEILKIKNERLNQVFNYSALYRIPADLAASIYDVALGEGIEPAVAFRLIKIESDFKRDAKSGAGAVGYTQIRPSTARFYEPGLSPEQLQEPEINLRLGFRFLHSLIVKYDGDINLALVAYNRGPARVEQILQQGGDPANGYAEKVLHGTRRGTK